MQSRWIWFFIAIGVGVTAGLLYGWLLNPVEYIDTTPDTLREDYRTDYVLMVAEIFTGDKDTDQAARRLAILGSDHPSSTTLRALVFARQNNYPDNDLTLMEELSLAMQTWQPGLESLTP